MEEVKDKSGTLQTIIKFQEIFMRDKMDEAEIDGKIADGWIRARAFIEVMAVDKDTTESALEKHIDKIRSQDGIEIYKEEVDEAEEVENPPQKVPKAYSKISEIEFLVSSVENLIKFTFLYGPSSLEVLEPEKMELKMGELQDITNTISALVHQYASQGAGGIVTSPE